MKCEKPWAPPGGSSSPFPGFPQPHALFTKPPVPVLPIPTVSIFMFEIKGYEILGKAESPRYGLGSSCFLGSRSCEEGSGRKGRENWVGQRACSIQEPKCLAFPILDVEAANLFQGNI